MRRPRLFWRIYATYLVVVVLCTAAVGFYAVRSVRDFYLDHTERELQARAALVREQVIPAITADTPQQLESLVQRLGRASGTRITVIAADRPGAEQGHGARGLRFEPHADGEPRHASRVPHRPAGQAGTGDPVQRDAAAGHDVRRRPGHGGWTAHDDRPYGGAPHARQRGSGLAVRQHRGQRDRRRRARRDHRALRLPAHQRTDERRSRSGRSAWRPGTSRTSCSCRAWRSSPPSPRASTRWPRSWTTSCAGSLTSATSARPCWRAWSRASSPWTPTSASSP